MPKTNTFTAGHSDPSNFASKEIILVLQIFPHLNFSSPTTKKNKVWIFFGVTFILVRPSAHACDPTTSPWLNIACHVIEESWQNRKLKIIVLSIYTLHVCMHQHTKRINTEGKRIKTKGTSLHLWEPCQICLHLITFPLCICKRDRFFLLSFGFTLTCSIFLACCFLHEP